MSDTLTKVNNSLSNESNKEDRKKLISQIREWADLNTDALLEPSCKIFRDSSIEGFIGYQEASNYAVVFGDPVCAEQDKVSLAEAFKKYCSQKKLTIIYTIVSEAFANNIPKSLCPIKIEYGSKLILNPSIDPLKLTGSKAVLLRKKVKHATRDGAEAFEYQDYNSRLEQEIEQIGEEWLKGRQGPQVYIAHLNLFSNRKGKRWFVAKVGETYMGVLVLNQLKASSGWLLNNLILSESAPAGTSELLVTTAFKALQDEGCTQVIVGPVTGKQLENIEGISSFSGWLLKFMFRSAKKMFRLDGQTQFWDKFQPEDKPSYLLFETFNMRTLRALMTAFNVQIAK